MTFHPFRVVIPLAAVLASSVVVRAQAPPGRVVGVVTDQSGAVVPGVTIEIRNLDSGLARSTRSDQVGRYAFESLPAGRYQASAAFPAFETAIRGDVEVGAGQESVIDLVLSLARQEAAVVVTAPSMSRPLAVVTDPRAPRQPIPAHDGADYLKTIPGFSVVRKGGTDGDPVLRGMAGSRLGVLLDGQQILGGCGGRMDPPTAYVFPAAYERITVFKGPQTVLYGAGTSAGTVLFERDVKRAERPEVAFSSSQTVGGFGRHDEMVDVRAAIPDAYVQAVATRSHAGDYSDGHGVAVHSFYTRWSGTAAAGWTPTANTLLELSLAKSNGRVAYADRGMDGTGFARDNVAIKFDTRSSWSVVRRIEAQSYYNYVDHVMDNFSLRAPGPAYSVNNPDRTTLGGRLAVTLAPDGSTTVVAGADTEHNVHRFRGATSKASADLAMRSYTSALRAEDVRFSQIGVFGEATRLLTPRSRLIGGVRADWHEAVDSRACVATTTCPADSPLKNDTIGEGDRKTLASGFGRYEREITRGGAGTFYVGLGHAERFPDYWERLKQSPATLKSAFLTTRPEKTTQLDMGMLWKSETWSGTVSAFAGRVRDYILIRWKPAPVVTRNVDATTLGGEADVTRDLGRNFRAEATLAWVRATNDTDARPLAQQPPPEARLDLQYDNRAYSFAALARLVTSQHRVDVGSGSIVANGMDLGPTGGFAVFSVNAGHRFRKVLVAGGIDNLFNRTYAEHISQGGAMVPGFVQSMRINEPGRTAWLKVNIDIK